MTNADETQNAKTPKTEAHDQTVGDVGDLEVAGETTAAEMIGGEPDTRPVGQDSLADIKVSDERE
ncbi:MAG TPA: hypothetical protein VGW12_15720 [Pyrinomonadaceae bacterium]|nr:hypothetical protein [Pyrinomonadaceae bacterium]